MNLNKYDAQGWLYSSEEAADRALALFGHAYVCRGYKRQTDKDAASPTFGLMLPEAQVKPYSVGRNAAKREARAAADRLARKINGAHK